MTLNLFQALSTEPQGGDLRCVGRRRQLLPTLNHSSTAAGASGPGFGFAGLGSPKASNTRLDSQAAIKRFLFFLLFFSATVAIGLWGKVDGKRQQLEALVP